MGKFLFLEPFYGGSHKYFVDGLIKHSSHKIELITLPDRFWKWRMRGSALHLSNEIREVASYDAIIASNMLSLSDLKSLLGRNAPPLVLYFHENQILYPLSKGASKDFHYGFTDITSALAADTIFFNSNYHKEAFLGAIPLFLKHMPDFRPHWVTEKIREKSFVLYPGINFSNRKKKLPFGEKGPLIIWNQRWEHDKNPEAFFEVLSRLKDEKIPFRLAVLGEKKIQCPPIFDMIKTTLADKIVHYGYAKDREEYWNWLNQGDIVISTAIQENFGISVLEAIGRGSFPLLPNRLSYRELIPESVQRLCIYKNENDLFKKLKSLIRFYDIELTGVIAEQTLKFSWENLISDYDGELDRFIERE